MADAIQSWEREHYEAGGGDPFLFYVVYGDINMSEGLSRSKYRLERKPEELELMAYGSNDPEAVNSFREGFLWETLSESDPGLAEEIAAQESCYVIRGNFTDPQTLDYLRDTVGLITYLLDQGGVAVYDPQMFRFWSPEMWMERIFDPAAAVPRNHTIILTSEDEDGEWIHTRGLRKFGRPDISIRQVAPESRDGIIDLCNRFIEYQAFGGVITEGEEIHMSALPDGLRCFHRGSHDDPEFNNVHVAIE